MEDILTQLFYGSYSAFHDLSVITENLEQFRRGKISMQLKSQLSEEQFKLLQELLNSMNQSQTEDMERAFRAGVRLGAQFIIAACMTEKGDASTELEKEESE